MSIKFSPITRAVKALPASYALYALEHTPTHMRYYGSTDNIAQRLMNWMYLFNAPKQLPVPRRMAQLFAEHGRKLEDWAYLIIDQNKPAGYASRGNTVSKPEYAAIQFQMARAPDLLLNDPIGTSHGRPSNDQRVVGSWGPKGVSPLRYLNVMLGFYPGFKWPQQPPCHRPVDPRELIVMGALDLVPFVVHLHRSMSIKPKHLNPTPAAIDGLYQRWLAAQPAGFAQAHELPSTITTCQQALSLPNPAEWMRQQMQANAPTTLEDFIEVENAPLPAPLHADTSDELDTLIDGEDTPD